MNVYLAGFVVMIVLAVVNFFLVRGSRRGAGSPGEQAALRAYGSILILVGFALLAILTILGALSGW